CTPPANGGENAHGSRARDGQIGSRLGTPGEITAARRSEGTGGAASGLGTDGAPGARMRRCLILRQGASPLRPPAPLSLESRLYGSEEICQGFATPAKGAALDRSPRFRNGKLRRGKGGPRKEAASTLGSGSTGGVCLTNTGLLMEDAEESSNK